MSNTPDCLVLFSGGLDSILAARLLQEQGLHPLCLHFFSPFFGSPGKIRHWEAVHGLKIRAIDASRDFITMLVNSPPHGTGKTLNPCIDCKIVLLRAAREIMAATGAKFIATGEVSGQRPMSQRPDAMNIIARESGCQNELLRPLCARHCPPAPGCVSALVNLEKLPSISGRGRNAQLQLAKELEIEEIPTPAGGCRLTEIENSRRYWVILKRHQNNAGSRTVAELAKDFSLANLGRMFADHRDGFRHWVCIGRNRQDNQKIMAAKMDSDAILRLPFPGPLALCREGKSWPQEKLREAAEILASCTTRHGGSAVDIREGEGMTMRVCADRHAQTWGLPEWRDIREELRALRRQKQQDKKNTAAFLHNADVSASMTDEK
ncbi:MAG: tRNA(5-methylaminomethyl-2-thiouridylate) methyltransferase [Desulfovibrio sp.]|nr:tRNA(5-methylaminomethyl-2-thiouridylate) methyltransferase [Desulfovibrio sp.]